MAAVTMERTIEEIIAGWRDGELDGPAGPLFDEGFTVQEITATGGGGGTMPGSLGNMCSALTGSYDPCKGVYYQCC